MTFGGLPGGMWDGGKDSAGGPVMIAASIPDSTVFMSRESSGRQMMIVSRQLKSPDGVHHRGSLSPFGSGKPAEGGARCQRQRMTMTYGRERSI